MYQQHVPPHQIKHSLPTITIKHPQTGDLVTWRMSQPVKIWSQSAHKWCPGEISYITQDADGYCLDVRYWARPQLPKAKYLAPLSECLCPISSEFVCRTDWASGSKVECFSNSQKRWYKATVVDVIRYPDDKEDWLKIQWSLDITPPSNVNSTPSSNTPNAPQIMSKEVGRSSIWIRHRYPSMKHDDPPNGLASNTPKDPQNKPPISHKKQKKSKKRKKQSNKMNEETINDIISSSPPNRGPRSKEVSFSAPDAFRDGNNSQIRKFEAQNYEQKPTKSKKLSTDGTAFANLTPQFTAISPPAVQEADKEAFDYILDQMEDNQEEDQKSKSIDDVDIQGSPEFGAEYKPQDYKEKDINLKDLDDDLDKAFMSSDSSAENMSEEIDEEQQEEEDGYVSNAGSMIIRNTDNEEEEGEEDTESEEEEGSSDGKQAPVLLQSDSRLAIASNHHGSGWEEDKKEMIKEIEELKFRLEIAEQDLTEERETSGPLLKEVEMQKIRIAKLEEKNKKLKRQTESTNHLSPVQSPSPRDPNDRGEDDNEEEEDGLALSNESKERSDEMTAKLMEFKKSLNTPQRSKSKRHIRSFSFTSNSSLQSMADATRSDDYTLGRRESSNRFEGLKAQDLIDAVYDRKVTMLNEKIARQQQEEKKKDRKIAEYKQSALNRKREIAILEAELAEIKQSMAHSTTNQLAVDTQNITMYRDQVRKLTQTNDLLKKALQTADDNLKSVELKKQDLHEEFRAQRQITHTLQQKVQRVLQQNNTITTQIEALHAVLLKSNPLDHVHMGHQSHSRHYSMSAAHNHLDTIRKCNMRATQILHEIMDKNRRKRSNIHSKYGQRESINLFQHGTMEVNNNTHHHVNAAKRKSKIEHMASQHTHHHHHTNHTNGHNTHNTPHTHHDQDMDYGRYHSTKSTRFSDKSKANKSANMVQREKAFDFESPPVPYSQMNDPMSTRSRGYPMNTHHQERSIQTMNNNNNNNHEVPPPMTRQLTPNKVDQNGSGQYNVRMKRVSYDYVDGHHTSGSHHYKKPQMTHNKLYNQHISEEHSTPDPLSSPPSAYDMNQYFDKIWTVKFPRRSSKVGLFHSNKGLKTKIILDKTQIIFKCDSDQLLIKLLIAQISSYEISDKKNVSIYTKNGKKYKIKCDHEKQAAFWHNTLSQYIACATQ
eukprot:49945_1